MCYANIPFPLNYSKLLPHKSDKTALQLISFSLLLGILRQIG